MTVYTSTPQELLVNHSRFIGWARRIVVPEECQTLVSEARHAYPGATHYTWAYRIKESLSRAFDDGEPQGTAGRPILGNLTKQNWDETFVVVIRYFGGVKLGRGGLMRAYHQAALMALNATQAAIMVDVEHQVIQLGYAAFERLQRHLDRLTLTWHAEFGAEVTVHVDVQQNALDIFHSALHQASLRTWRLLESQSLKRLIPTTPR